MYTRRINMEALFRKESNFKRHYFKINLVFMWSVGISHRRKTMSLFLFPCACCWGNDEKVAQELDYETPTSSVYFHRTCYLGVTGPNTSDVYMEFCHFHVTFSWTQISSHNVGRDRHVHLGEYLKLFESTTSVPLRAIYLGKLESFTNRNILERFTFTTVAKR